MPSCLNCKKPSQDTLCADCHSNMQKSMESAPKALFPYLLPVGSKAPPPGVVIPEPVKPKPMVLEIRPRCLADKEDGQRCAMPSQYFFCAEHGRQWVVEKRQLESTINELREQLDNMEANHHNLAEAKRQEIKQLKAQLTTAEKCDECQKHTPELIRLCLDCYPEYVQSDLADDPYLREQVLDLLVWREPYLKMKDVRIKNLEEQLLQERQRNTMLCDTIRTQGIRVLDLERSLEKMSRNQRKGKRELQELQEGVRTIWGQEAKRPKRN